MPTHFKLPGKSPDKSKETEEYSDSSAEDDGGDDVSFAGINLGNYYKTGDCLLEGPGTTLGPRRYLQHDTAINLFFEYVATMKSRGYGAASFSTFMRVFRNMFNSHLGFRKKSQHAECTVCSLFKKGLQTAQTLAHRQASLDKYSKHIWEQWSDRQIYWANREMSHSLFFKNAKFGHKSEAEGGC
jgi:hypothetical protein